MGDFCTHHNLVHSTKGSRRANSENETMVKCDHFKIGSTEDLLEWYNDDLGQKKITSENFQELREVFMELCDATKAYIDT